MMLMSKPRRRRVYANDNDALIPDVWAKFSLAILESQMVAARLVHRDFENELASFGDVVNTRRPVGFTAKRKVDGDTVTVQDARTTNIAVPLDQHLHVSFLIKDGEESKSMQSLIDFHLIPAMTAMAEQLDRIVLGQTPRFLFDAGQAGTHAGMTSSNAKDYILELGQRLDESKAPSAGRQLIVPPTMKTKILTNSVFSEADKRGDSGTALREASMGRILGFDTYSCQNMASVASTDVATGFLVNNVAGYVKGDSTMVVDGGTGIITNGMWFRVAGELKMHQVTAHSETLGNTTSITFDPPLYGPVADNAAITLGDPGAVNLVAGYAAGWSKDIVVDGFTVFPKVGQALSFATSTGKDEVYTVIAASSADGTILLDRPLKTALADNAAINVVPTVASDMALGFTRNSIALVCRPLKLPRAGAGALAGSASHNGFSMRAVITYDGDKQGHLVTLDCLLGIQVLDENCGAVLLG
jgi:hypothetical protein